MTYEVITSISKDSSFIGKDMETQKNDTFAKWLDTKIHQT